MASTYDDDQVAKLRRVNELLRQALDKCQELLRHAEFGNNATGQDNEPPREVREN